MSVSGIGPGNAGTPFRTFQKGPLKNTALTKSPLEQKIRQALADNEDRFLRLQANELKIRASFYQNFEGKIGTRAMNDIEKQAYTIVDRLVAMGRKVEV